MRDDDRCEHGRFRDTCFPCRPTATSRRTPARGANYGGLTKQDCLNQLCGLLGLPGMSIGVGSSVPSDVFAALAARYRLPYHSMPQVAEAVARQAGVPWDGECDSRGTLSGGGSTVTLEGLQRLVRAVGRLQPPASAAPLRSPCVRAHQHSR